MQAALVAVDLYVESVPATDYGKAAAASFKAVKKGGGHNGLDRPAAALPVPYHPNVSMGWDSSPRCRSATDWTSRRGFPFGPVIVNNTPTAFPSGRRLWPPPIHLVTES